MMLLPSILHCCKSLIIAHIISFRLVMADLPSINLTSGRS